MRLKEPDLLEISKWFETALGRMSRVDRQKKMRMRRKIRDEIYLLLTWERPTPSMILNRWEERLSDVLKALPHDSKDELLKLLLKKMQMPKA